MSLLAANNISISIGGQMVCRDLTLRFEKGQIWAVLGSNGVGKTTLLHTLAGLRSPLGGSVELMNQPLDQLKRRYISQHLGVLFQQQDEPFPSSVIQTALIGRHPFIERWRGETAEDFSIAEEALAAVELSEFHDRFSNTLSGGEKQRLKIATLLTQRPQIMLLDEPTNHLDLNHQIKLLSLLTQYIEEQQGILLMVLHDLNLANRFCSHGLLLSPDREPIAGALSDVLQPDTLEQAYGWPVERINVDGKEFFHPR